MSKSTPPNQVVYLQEFSGFSAEEMEVFPGCPNVVNGYAYVDDSKWSDEDFVQYRELVWLDIDDQAWDCWSSEHWPEEQKRRIWNYQHVYFNNAENIKWFLDSKLVFDRSEYENCMEQFLLEE